ncbi:MAG: DUF5652 family protein [Parcubacteria group bacterium]
MQDTILTTPVLLTILIWTLPWKGIALWKAAKNGQKKWFIVMLVFNTLALLEIIYIFYFGTKRENKILPR